MAAVEACVARLMSQGTTEMPAGIGDGQGKLIKHYLEKRRNQQQVELEMF